MPMQPDALVAELRPLKLPAELSAVTSGDVLAALAIGILAALLVAALARLVARRRRDRRAEVAAALAALRGRPAEERLYGQALLLRELRPATASRRPRQAANTAEEAEAAIPSETGIGAALYRPPGAGPAPDLDALDARILRAARRRAG
ncbi:hypothetical protein [Aurantimonas sp. Leaf443]|uniref:hypothetical protein n=1 Tax=Aurantimonas sp. Leaf443 TaxID=1736378 RepID=UPI0006FD81E1|nr:hypothetical protein [Aurantimonas sp. Leaf443]KQT82186.1 hypothetical protein ASG48_16235 [Aurantimonas sp. Leaf443]